jgi:hypothetical protein
VCAGAERACERRSRCNGASHAACSVRSGPVQCVCVVCAALFALAFAAVHAVGSVYTAVESRECCARCARLLVLATMWCVNETEFLASFMFPNSFPSAPISHPAELRERRPTKQSRCGPLRLLASTRRVRLLVSTRLDSSPSLRCASYPCPRTEPLLLRPRGRRGRCCRRGQPPRCRPQRGLRAPPSSRAPRSLSSTG